MTSYRLSPEALADLREIGDWIARGSPARAVSFIAELRGRFGRLAGMPLTGRSREEMGAGIRSVPYGAYVIFYRPTGSGIDVVRVVHGRRDLSQGLP